MKHSARDFAQAEFARHRDGRKAFRRTGVGSDQPWAYMKGGRMVAQSDARMAEDGGWTTVQTMDPEPTVEMIRDPRDLAEFASNYGLRADWHEPDERNIGARIIGRSLDNAMGSTTRHEHADWGGEFNIVLTHMEYDEEGGNMTHTDLSVVNLATLLSWAAQHGECQR